MSEAAQPVFSLDKIYIKDSSLEVPNAPKIFLKQGQPSIELNINFNTNSIDNGVFQTIITATVDAKVENEQMFLIELQQAAIFQIRNIPEEQMEMVLNIECPNMLFPYLRESVSDLTSRAGFAPVILAPINFAFLYQQRKAGEVEAVSNSVN